LVKRDADLTRRQVVGAAGTTGVALLFGGVASGRSGAQDADVAEAAATCVMTPAKTEGPYFVDERLNRSDIRSDAATGAMQEGVKLTLKLSVFDAGNDCAPVRGAQVDIWHANASGRYSDEAANGTTGEKWLRGYQRTDADGAVTFTTIYPGWYRGRITHIHFQLYLNNGLVATSQLAFPQDITTAVYDSALYKAHGQNSSVGSFAQDNVFSDGTTGEMLTLTGDPSSGYTATLTAGVAV
jgi:protocatechuate 3,4-dioxygenase beta subunit